MSDIEQYFSDLQSHLYDDEKWATAPCTTMGDPDAWFNHDGHMSNEEVKVLGVVLSMCETCPFKDECLAMGMEGDNILYGIWGGTFPSERQILAGYGNRTSTKRFQSATLGLRRRVKRLTGDRV